MSVVTGISYNSADKEYRIFWKENGRDIEAKAGYETDPQSAVDTLISEVKLARNRGIDVEVAHSRYTTNLLMKYAYDFVWDEIRRAARKATNKEDSTPKQAWDEN